MVQNRKVTLRPVVGIPGLYGLEKQRKLATYPLAHCSAPRRLEARRFLIEVRHRNLQRAGPGTAGGGIGAALVGNAPGGIFWSTATPPRRASIIIVSVNTTTTDL